MEIIKIFKGGYINKEQVINDPEITDKINTTKTNVIFDKTENIFKTEFETLEDEDVFKLMKTQLEADITSAKTEKDKKTLEAQLLIVNKYLEPRAKPEMKAVYKKDLKKLFDKTLLIRQDEIRKNKQKDYIEIFNSIVPFQPNSEGNLFSFLEKNKDKGFIIYDFQGKHEIYSKPGEPPLEYYVLKQNFTLLKVTLREFGNLFENKIPDESLDLLEYNLQKVEGYPLFPSNVHYSGSIIEAQLLDAQKMTSNMAPSQQKSPGKTFCSHFAGKQGLFCRSS